MRAVIPFDVRTPKRRLSGVLEPDERAAFARTMLRDVIDAMEPTRFEPTVVATGPVEAGVGAPVEVDDRPLDDAVDAAIDAGTPVAVVMADLPLVTPQTLERFAKTEGEVVFAPGIGGGTNAMIVRDGSFSVDYHGVSIRDHRGIARDARLSVGEIDSFRLGTDVDEPEDLLEVLLHGEGQSVAWLESAGFRVETTDGRATATR
mgnify:CR=1 FL=1